MDERYTPHLAQLECGCFEARWEARYVSARGRTPLEAVDKLKALLARHDGLRVRFPKPDYPWGEG